MIKYLIILILTGGFQLHLVTAQPFPEDSSGIEITSLFGLPIAYYTPETRWAGGIAGLMNFRFRKDSADISRPSQLQIGAAYTQERQFLSYLPFSIFADNNRWYFYGELGYYRYSYFFYGIGNENTIPEGELYDVNFPRIRVHGMKLIAPHLYLGAHYWLDAFEIADLDAGDRLADPVRNITGREGGIISAPGLIALLDKREDVFAPESGYYLESLVQMSRPWTGSTFRYERFTLDGRYYLPVVSRLHHILAVQIYADLTNGNVPFNALPLLGGTRRMRGYYEGRYRDNNLLSAQVEYRFPLFWRLGMVAFGGVGTVFPAWKEFSPAYLRAAGGAGLRIRISNTDRVNARIDAAFGPGTTGYYITIGEAF